MQAWCCGVEVGVAVEVDGPRRFYHGSRERIAVCETGWQGLATGTAYTLKTVLTI